MPKRRTKDSQVLPGPYSQSVGFPSPKRLFLNRVGPIQPMNVESCHQGGCSQDASTTSSFMKLCDIHYNQFMTPDEVLKDPAYQKCFNCNNKSEAFISVHNAYRDLFTVDTFVGLCRDHAKCDMGHPVPSFECGSFPTQILSCFWRLSPPEKKNLKFCDDHMDIFTELCQLHPNMDRSVIAFKMLKSGNVAEGVMLAPVEGPYL